MVVVKAFLSCNVYVIMAVKSPFSFMLQYCGGCFCCDVYLMMASTILLCCGGDLRMLRHSLVAGWHGLHAAAPGRCAAGVTFWH